ncbi:MAG TPA: hypothetical protein VLE96_00290 [Chlamydiales bacterium]|nr:hypothetical protein [Chlamydiales bacterium]
MTTISGFGSQTNQSEAEQLVNFKNAVINGSMELNNVFSVFNNRSIKQRDKSAETLNSLKELITIDRTDLKSERKYLLLRDYGFIADNNSFAPETSILTKIICFLSQHTIFGSINKIQRSIAHLENLEQKIQLQILSLF